MVELGGNGSRLGVNRRAKTVDLSSQASPLGACTRMLLTVGAAVDRVLAHRNA